MRPSCNSGLAGARRCLNDHINAFKLRFDPLDLVLSRLPVVVLSHQVDEGVDVLLGESRSSRVVGKGFVASRPFASRRACHFGEAEVAGSVVERGSPRETQGERKERDAQFASAVSPFSAACRSALLHTSPAHPCLRNTLEFALHLDYQLWESYCYTPPLPRRQMRALSVTRDGLLTMSREASPLPPSSPPFDGPLSPLSSDIEQLEDDEGSNEEQSQEEGEETGARAETPIPHAYTFPSSDPGVNSTSPPRPGESKAKFRQRKGHKKRVRTVTAENAEREEERERVFLAQVDAARVAREVAALEAARQKKEVIESVLSELYKNGLTWGDLLVYVVEGHWRAPPVANDEWRIHGDVTSLPNAGRFDCLFTVPGRMTRLMSAWTSSRNTKFGRRWMTEWALQHVKGLVNKEGNAVGKDGFLISARKKVDSSFLLTFDLRAIHMRLRALCPITTTILRTFSTTPRQVKTATESSAQRNDMVSGYMPRSSSH